MYVFSIFVLILTKALSKRVFFSIFALTLPKALATKGVCFFLFLQLFKPKQMGFFSIVCPYYRQIFFLMLTKVFPKGCFHVFFGPYSKKAGSKRVFCSIFALTLTNALPKKCFFLFVPLF